MSNHAWAQEAIAAYIAGGLDPADRQRLDDHARDCPECSTALREMGQFDDTLGSLFADARPGPTLEDRMIKSLHVVTTVSRRRRFGKHPVLWGAAASIGIGFLGAGTTSMLDGELPFPWTSPPPTVTTVTGAASTSSLEATRSLERSRTRFATTWEVQSGGGAPLLGDDTRMNEESRKKAQSRGFYNDLVPGQPGMGGGPAGPAGPGGDARLGLGPANGAVPPSVSYGFGVPNVNAEANKSLGATPRTDTLYYSPAKVQTSVLGVAPAENKGVDPKQNPPVDRPAPAPGAAPPEDKAPVVANMTRKIIRTGEIEFEIESFDSAVANVIKLVGGIKGGYIATVNSEKLANGKVKGSVVVRVPPESLDGLVLDLRRDLAKGGELKGQRIGSQDITKQYTDLESRLRAARTMEERLLKIIKDGKGEIKQLLEAEKELGVWRTKIEEMEGELRYFANQVSLSTLTVTLTEKEIRTAAVMTENERVQAGIEVEDVEQAQQQLLSAVTEAKGRVSKSELKQHGAGQFAAAIHFEVAPDKAGALRDRLRQLGTIARFEIDRTQKAEGGTPPKDGKITRGDTMFLVDLYNITRMAPRETATLSIAAVDVGASYRTLQDAIRKAKGRVLTADLNEQDRRNVRGQLDFEVRREDEPALREALTAAGDTVSRQIARAEENANTTDAKIRFRTTLFSAAQLPPRETTTLSIEVTDVDQTAAALTAQTTEAKGRIIRNDISRERDGRVTARMTVDVPLAVAPGLAAQFRNAGAVRVQQTERNPQAHDGPLATARLEVTLSNTELIVPADDGLWPQVRKGLAWSVRALLLSVSWLIVGLLVVVPWIVVGLFAYRVGRRVFRSSPA